MQKNMDHTSQEQDAFNDFSSPDALAIEGHLKKFTYICISLLLIFCVFNAMASFYHAILIDIIGIAFYLLGLGYLYATRRITFPAVNLIFTCCMILFLQSIILEPDAYHNMFWFPTVGLFCFALFNKKKYTIFCFAMTFAAGVASYIFPKYYATTTWPLTQAEKDVYIILSIVGSLFATYKVGETVYNQKKSAFRRLSEANKRLAEVNDKNKSLLQLIIHDVSNPLVSIDFAVKLAKHTENNGESLERISTICNPAILTIREIIESAREMMALEDGKLTTVPIPTGLKAVVNDTVSQLRDTAHKKNVKISLNFNMPDSTFVWMEPKSFKSSVLTNLLTNAIKFSNRNSEVKILVEQGSGKEAVLKIMDTGIGMPEEHLNKIFNPTEKTTRHGTEGERGTGYGMPLAKAFIESYGGKIECVSEENIGTLVKLTLPMAEVTCAR